MIQKKGTDYICLFVLINCIQVTFLNEDTKFYNNLTATLKMSHILFFEYATIKQWFYISEVAPHGSIIYISQYYCHVNLKQYI